MHRLWRPKIAPLVSPIRVGVDVSRGLRRNALNVVKASTGDRWTLLRSRIDCQLGWSLIVPTPGTRAGRNDKAASRKTSKQAGEVNTLSRLSLIPLTFLV